ncbi:N-acyl-D-amino-acid deacylase family protein [Vineibacter terrae]|uniref:N-acyl-D-amino-acid deacylase family protein n=1 Tax=Vineibacter terrae TaxID=2586908 RepID=UPI002E35ECD5|nr:amidohydrolase family protein [Vineibacter terrae]HEX2890263.1 amidohydrolase family protein [Vineibacter terrae]
MARYDRVIRGGTIIDGARLPRFRGDIAIRDGIIAEIGRIDPADAREVIDADGLIVAPGFVDLHTHYDAQVFWDPYCTLSGWHGITSVVIGNCGFGFAPVRPEMRERAMMTMTRVEAIPMASMQQGMPWDWVTFPEFLDSVERTPKAMNILPYVPIAPLLIWVMGFDAAKAGARPTDAQHAELCRLLHEAMDAGGCGWSAQRMLPSGPACVQRDFDGSPMPTDVMHDDTCRALASVLRERNEGFMQMLLVSGDNAQDQRFYEEMAEISGRPMIMNVVQAFDHRPEIHRRVLAWLRSCRERGIRVVGQGLTTDAGFTFTFENWNLFDDIQAWCDATTGTLAERKQKLADPARRQALRENMPKTATGPLPQIVIVGPQTEGNKKWLDHTLALAGEKMGKHPVDVMLDMAVEEDLKTEFFAAPPNGKIEHLKELVDDPYVLFGVSDGGAHTKFLTAGRYPTETLCKVVREHGMISLEEAHWRLSALPAQVAGFEGRGVLRKGAPADIVVYDFDQLAVLPDEIVHDLPGGEWRRVQRARGYRYVLVNGEVTIRDDQQTGTCSGQLLRHGVGRRTLMPRAA